MIVLDNSSPPSYKEPRSSGSLFNRQASTNTTSPPPPYESSNMQAPLLNRDEKRRQSRGHHGLLPVQRETHPREKDLVYAEPPPAFSRVAAVDAQTLKSFDPLTVLVGGSGRSLDKGFSLDVPPSTEDIHPFVQRDISAADWNRFMQDLRDGTAMSNCTKQKMLFIPLALGLGPGAFFVSRAVKAKIRRKKLAYAINLINTWNQYFFGPRCTEVVLMQGTRPLSSSKSIAQLEKLNRREHDKLWSVSLSSHYDSSSSSDEESGGCCHQRRTPMRLVVVSL